MTVMAPGLPRYIHQHRRRSKSRLFQLAARILFWVAFVVLIISQCLRLLSIYLPPAALLWTNYAVAPRSGRESLMWETLPLPEKESLIVDRAGNEAALSDNIDENDDDDYEFRKAPRRPADWAPPLQSLLESSFLREEKAKKRLLETHEKPWNASKQWDVAFPPYKEYATLVKKASGLPDLIYIPFDTAVADEHLEGWEDEWVSEAHYNVEQWGKLTEPKIDFIYTWVNGTDESFQNTKTPYEWNSSLNDNEGAWLGKHSKNRYRDWDELRYSLRSIEENAPFHNKIQILVNAVRDAVSGIVSKQEPWWLSRDDTTRETVQILAQEEFFEHDKRGCLPSFNSLTMENQIHNTLSDVDQVFALSDDMLLGKPFAASDIYSPLFGPMMGFKTNSYNTRSKPTAADAQRFGEKPWLIYTSWLFNRRFGARKRKGQSHFGHSLSRKVMRETSKSFPAPELQSACSRFRGDFNFQLYSWFAAFHYTIERHREALLWSYIMVRADKDDDGYLSWDEREVVLREVNEGMANEHQSSFRVRHYYHLPDILEEAGIEPPSVNVDVLWTSLDGPAMIKSIDCFDFDINECLAPGFTMAEENERTSNPVFSTAAVFDRVSRQQPECGDCLIKILLHRVRKGLSPLLPDKILHPAEYETVIKSLMKYQYTVMDPDALFVMVTDAEQVETSLIKRFQKKEKHVGQLCINDDVSSEDAADLQDLRSAITDMFQGLFPKRSQWEHGGY